MAYVKKIWKDYPDTTTPILASDMNNIENGIENIENGIEELDTRLNDEEMYVQATAGANGDFFVNLTNKTLVNGRIVKISFPTATNPSANARLSIDGGSNYKNIKYENGVQALASDIQSVDYELKYNGTDFITINSKEKVLYNNATGSSTTLTLSETLANFKYIEIFYRNNDSVYQSLRVFEPNNKKVNIFTFTMRDDIDRAYIKAADVSLSGTSMSMPTTGFGLNGEITITTPNAVSAVVPENRMYITRVLGFRK